MAAAAAAAFFRPHPSLSLSCFYPERVIEDTPRETSLISDGGARGEGGECVFLSHTRRRAKQCGPGAFSKFARDPFELYRGGGSSSSSPAIVARGHRTRMKNPWALVCISDIYLRPPLPDRVRCGVNAFIRCVCIYARRGRTSS